MSFTHVVCFRFENQEVAAEAVSRLLSMRDQVEGLASIEAGVDLTRSERSYDVALITRHADKAGYAMYAQDPIHLDVLAWLKPRIQAVVAVDF